MITLTGLDCSSFNFLAEIFTPFFDDHSPFLRTVDSIFKFQKKKTGRPRKVKAIDCLGLTLAWTRTRGSCMALQSMFGMTMTNLNKYMRFGRRILIKVLERHPEAMVEAPSPKRIGFLKQLVHQRHPNLKDVWCTMDGLKIPIEMPPDIDIQERFYNGWQHGHYITNVLCFCPDGTIPIAFVNLPGSMHDSMVAELGGIYDELERAFQLTGGKCTIDSAFSSSTRPFLLKSSQNYQREVGGETAEEVRRNLGVAKDATSMRQSAEWGMRAFQSSFPRLKDTMLYEDGGERRVILKMCLLLFNLRANLVEINQIRSHYLTYLDLDVYDEFDNFFTDYEWDSNDSGDNDELSDSDSNVE
jgi:hypothetical protein